MWDFIVLFILIGIWVLFEIWILYSLRTPWKFNFTLNTPHIFPKPNVDLPIEHKKHHFFQPPNIYDIDNEKKDIFPENLNSKIFPTM
jgi:hypothetical protein